MGTGKEGSKLSFVNGLCAGCCFAGDVLTKGGAEQRDGVPDAPEQHPRSGGHVHVDRAARSRHLAQPLSPLREGQHLCTCVRLGNSAGA